jgi:hypothetical protein
MATNKMRTKQNTTNCQKYWKMLTRHAKSQNHMQLEMVQRTSKSMSLFVTSPNNSLKSKTTSAETQFCNFIAEHNIVIITRA